MNILLVVHQFLPDHLGGTEIYTYNLAKALMDRGHEISIYTREQGYFEESIAEENVQYDCIKIKKVYCNPINKRFKFLNKFNLNFYNPVIEKHFNNHLNETKPDIIHFQHLTGLSVSLINVAKKSKIPSILTLHDFWFMCNTIQLHPGLCPAILIGAILQDAQTARGQAVGLP